MLEIIPLQKKNKWNCIVTSFKDWDIYYLNEYAHSLFVHGDGVPYLILVSNMGKKMAHVVFQSDISEFPPFQNALDKDTFYDWSTPYGYGGPLLDGDIDKQFMSAAELEVAEFAKENGIVSEFFRFHPLLQNQKELEEIMDVRYLKKTIYMDTSSNEIINANMTPNARNMTRKAEKNGVEIRIDHGENLNEFITIYNETMRYNHVGDYYFFEQSYYEDMIENMKDHVVFFYAVYDKRIISASIFLYNDQFMHYHLSGTLPEFRKMAAANLILTRAAYWACDRGIKYFHLGGGVDNEDSLLRFKKHFNRNGQIDFCIGRRIFLPDKYEEFVNLRKKMDAGFNERTNFLIQYRG